MKVGLNPYNPVQITALLNIGEVNVFNIFRKEIPFFQEAVNINS